MRWIRSGLFYMGVSTLVLTVFIGRSLASVTLNSSLSISEEYTDNFFFTDEEPEEEWTTTTTPAIGLVFDNNDMVLSTEYRGGVEFYLKHRNESRYVHGFSLGLDFPFLSRQIKGVRVNVTHTMTYTPQPRPFSYNDKTGGANQGIQVSRTDTFENRTAVAVGYSWTPRFSTTLSYGYLVTRYKGEGLQDSTVQDAALEAAYALTSRTTGMIAYGASVIDYSDTDDVLSHYVNLGATHQISPTFSGNARFGVASIPGESTIFTLEMGISKSARWGGGSLQLRQGLGTGGGVTTSATLNQQITGQLTWLATRDSSAYVQLAYGENSTLPKKGTKVSTYEAGAGIRMTFLSWLNGSLAYFYLTQQAQGAGNIEGERNRAIFTLTATAPPWRLIK